MIVRNIFNVGELKKMKIEETVKIEFIENTDGILSVEREVYPPNS